MSESLPYNDVRKKACTGGCCSVSNQDKTADENVVDPFNLLKRIRSGVKEISEGMETSPQEITFLWIEVSDKGIAQAEDSSGDSVKLTLDDWLNVVDEAAAYGVNWLVLTMRTSLSSFPEVVDIAQWAQTTHGMMVGLHTSASSFTQDELGSIQELDRQLLTVFVKQDSLDAFAPLVAEGVNVAVADPQEYGKRPNCQGPSRMIFVSAEGELYTCGLVKGNREYHLGSVFEDTFLNILRDPELPHALPAQIHRVASGCDGCPALIANYQQGS